MVDKKVNKNIIAKLFILIIIKINNKSLNVEDNNIKKSNDLKNFN